MLLRFFIFLSLVFNNVSFAQPKENRVALVVGNSAYKTAPLRNPTNDAKDMAAKLKGMGFTVIERSNLSVKQIGSTLREFRAKLTPGSVALVFYAGHGLQIKGENYLPAVDAEINGEEDVPTQSLAMRQIMDVLEEAKTRLNLVFLDACRNNPYARSFRSASDGLNRINAPSGTLISFATRPGNVAADGTGRNGLYTGALLEQMNNQSLPIEQVLKKVVTQVKAASNNLQEPWMEGSIEGEFCFGECVMTTAQNGSAMPLPSIKPMASLPACTGSKLELWDKCIGNIKYPNNNLYYGEFQKGKRHGYGRMRILAIGQSDPMNIRSVVPATFEGNFKDGSINGRGILLLDSGERFEGEFLNNQFIGNGTESTITSTPANTPTIPIVSPASSTPTRVLKDCKECPDLVVIPAGSFGMGSKKTTRPVHIVQVREFLLGKTEITQGQWKAVMGNNPAYFNRCGDDCPVEQVSWEDAQAFAKKLSQKTGQQYRLPSEAEWEYAARAGSDEKWSYVDEKVQLIDYAWYSLNSEKKIHAVAIKRPNAFGLFDMHGNVWEWTQDCWNSNYTNAPTDGAAWITGDCSRHAKRGGSWSALARYLHPAYRVDEAGTVRSHKIGFRVARSLPQ